MRKVYVKIEARVIVQADDGVEISEVINEMDYHFVSQTEGADIVDGEIQEFEVIDSK